MAACTAIQGSYLKFIHTYTRAHGTPPAESEIAAGMGVSLAAVKKMAKMLEKKGLILVRPGEPGSLEVLIPEHEIPPLKKRKRAKPRVRKAKSSRQPSAPPPPSAASLYVFSVYLMGGPISKEFADKEISRMIEIRGDQTLDQLHHAIFKAYDRLEDHRYEFQFGKRPNDPGGPNYGVPDPRAVQKKVNNATATKLDDLGLELDRVFGYLFDFGEEWFHQVHVERIECAIPTETYPRVIRRVGKSPPQYCDE
jgi:hypothetical protein